jgi:DNA polymerase III delta prime subunit
MDKIDEFINKKYIPNLLLYGPYNKGKENLCKYFINKVYQTKENIDKYVLDINCLTTNGIKMIKEYIKLFSMQIIHKESNIYFKTIILRYSEYLTYDSQYSLRRTIEQYNKNTRFILLCESKSKLLSPICSRFVHLYINHPTQQSNHCGIVTTRNTKLLNKILKKYYSILDNDEIKDKSISIMKIAEELHNNMFVCNEIIEKFKKNQNYHIMKLVEANMTTNFRNERLSIFYVLNVFRNNHKIQIYELY